MFPEVRGECEELNNSPQVEATTDGRPLTRYAANSRSNGAAKRLWRLGWRTREFGDQGWRAREFGDQGWISRDNGDFAGKARVPCAKADNGTPPDFGLSGEPWTGRRSATSRQWSGTQACHKHHGNQRDGSSGWSNDRKRYVKDKWVNQEQRRGSLRGARLLRRDVQDWDTRNLRIETQVAEVQRASHG